MDPSARKQETIQYVQPLMPNLSYASCSSRFRQPSYLQGVGNDCHDPHCSRRQFRFAEHSAGFLNRHGMSCNPYAAVVRKETALESHHGVLDVMDIVKKTRIEATLRVN